MRISRKSSFQSTPDRANFLNGESAKRVAAVLLLASSAFMASCQARSLGAHSETARVPGNGSQTETATGADYRRLQCRKPVLEPYTGPLLVDSKYDQSDVSKSTLSNKVNKQSDEIHQRVAEYTKMLVNFADYYVKAKDADHADMALSCVDEWLETWAKADALETRDATKTGMAVRKWALAAMSSVVLKMQHLSNNRLQLSNTQKQWFADLADIVIDDYKSRQEPGFAYFNNHDYWAGWAIASTGMVLGKRDYIEWGDRNFRKGLAQITLSKDGSYGYLPNELARGKLAANYTHYALVPLVLLAESARTNGLGLSDAETKKLALLANFAARIVLSPASLPELEGQAQSDVPAYKMAWLIPFLTRNPNHELARELYRYEDGEVDGYSQIGGQIMPLYPDFKQGKG